jgi:hypothetical protein
MLLPPPLDRREFTLRSALALLGGVTITISPGCGGGGSSYNASSSPTAPRTPTGTNTDTVASISNNHGHQAAITSAQLIAGNTIMLNIQGSADHPHTVQLTAADLSAIGNLQPVAKECSSTSSHTHMVTFARGAEGPGPGY